MTAVLLRDLCFSRDKADPDVVKLCEALGDLAGNVAVEVRTERHDFGMSYRVLILYFLGVGQIHYKTLSQIATALDTDDIAVQPAHNEVEVVVKGRTVRMRPVLKLQVVK